MLGILIDIISHSELENINEICKDNDIFLFGDISLPPIPLEHLPLFSTERSFDFDGPLMSTNIKTTRVLLNNKSARKKLFYVRDREWMGYQEGAPYSLFISVYQNKDIHTIAATPEIKRDLSEFFNHPLGVADKWDFSKIKELKNEI
jgi:hypothetical protein